MLLMDYLWGRNLLRRHTDSLSKGTHNHKLLAVYKGVNYWNAKQGAVKHRVYILESPAPKLQVLARQFAIPM